ncbi:MAG: hypothetical protein ACOCV7_06935, partial [Desulfonatronovibrionaceae bacterium]
MSDNPQKGFLDRLISEADDSAHPFLEKIRDHIRTIVVVITVILVSAAGYSLYSFLQDRKVSAANQELESVLSIKDPDQRIAGLKEFLAA